MQPVDKLQADRKRHAQAVQAALDKTTLLKQEAEKLNALGSVALKDEYVNRVMAHREAGQAPAPPGARAAEGAAAGISSSSGARPSGVTIPPGAAAKALAPQAAPPTQTLVEKVKLRRAEVQQATATELHGKRELLRVQQQQLEQSIDASKAKLHGHTRKKMSLEAALKEDERLENMSSKAVLQEFLTSSHSSRSPYDLATPSAAQPSGALRKSASAGGAARPAGGGIGTAAQQEEEEEEDDDEEEEEVDDEEEDEEEESDDEDDEEEDDEDDDDDDGEEESDWQQQLDEALKSNNVARVQQLRQQRPARVPILQAQHIGGLIKRLRHGQQAEQGGEGGTASVTLGTVVDALKQDLHMQEEALHRLKVQHQVAATRLDWARHRPATYERRPTATAKQMAAKTLCRELVEELLVTAMSVVDMRPSLAQVRAELQEWKANQGLRLMDMARHMADSVLKDCVDEIIAEVSGEVEHLQRAAEGFATSMLVEAIATSQGQYGVRPHQHDTVRARLRQAAAEQEALLKEQQEQRVLAAQQREAARAQGGAGGDDGGGASASGDGRPSASTTATRRAATPEQPLGDPDEEDVIMQYALAARNRQLQRGASRGVGRPADQQQGAGDDVQRGSDVRSHDLALSDAERASRSPSLQLSDAEGKPQQPVLGPTWDRDARSLPPRVARDAQGELSDLDLALARARSTALSPQAFDDRALSADELQHYLLGIRGMLHEMQRIRDRAPYGHTQQLSLNIPPDAQLTKVQRFLLATAVPHLAAGPSVWALRRRATRKSGFGVYPSVNAIKASELEASFWDKVLVKPFFLGETSPLMFVDKSLGPITCCAPSSHGTFLALGTLHGGVLVYDVRNQPSNPWYLVVGSGGGRALAPHGSASAKRGGRDGKGGAAGAAGQAAQVPPVMSIAWSADDNQFASLDASFTLRVWCMKPAPGQAVSEDANRQPVVPLLVMAVNPRAAATSGKGLVPTLMDDIATQRQPGASSWAFAFAAEFTSLGSQPAVVIPQGTGDVLRVSSRAFAGPLLPSPLPRVLAWGAQAAAKAAAPVLGPTTADFLLPPQQPNEAQVESQALYRAHEGQVVFVGHLGDGASLVSVDSLGQIHVWPSRDHPRTGFGWHKPVHTWKLPRSIKAYQPRGQAYPVWPPVQTAAQPLPPPLPAREAKKGGFGSWFGGLGKGGRDGVPQVPLLPTAAPLPTSFQDYLADPGLHDTPAEPSRLLEEDPQGGWMQQARLPWLVHYKWDTEEDKRGRLVRREVRRPHPSMGPGKPLLVSTTACPGGQLLSRQKQAAVLTKLDYRVISATMSEGGNDLVVWLHLAGGAHGDVAGGAWGGIMSAHVVNMSSARPVTPRIDVYDHSNGTAAPAFALTPPVNTLGSEYMFVGLGCGMVGVFSVATGQLVRELSLGMPATSQHFAALALFEVAPVLAGSCANAGKMILAAVPSESLYVHLFEIDDELGTLETVKRSQPPLVRVLPQPGAPPRPLAQPGAAPQAQQAQGQGQALRPTPSMEARAQAQAQMEAAQQAGARAAVAAPTAPPAPPAPGQAPP